jgi:hypothetical protein
LAVPVFAALLVASFWPALWAQAQGGGLSVKGCNAADDEGRELNGLAQKVGILITALFYCARLWRI